MTYGCISDNVKFIFFQSIFFNPIRPGDLDPGKFPWGGAKVPIFNSGALNYCLALKFSVFIESYVKLANQKQKIKKCRKQPKIQIIEKTFWIFLTPQKYPLLSQNSLFWALVFFANILIFIVLIDSTKKTLGYRRSCGVTFENLEFFRF